MKEIIINNDITIIELMRREQDGNIYYNYYIETSWNGNLYHATGSLEPMTADEIHNLYNIGYFDSIIEDIPE